jgi:ABC-type sugar transport system substrate-binding protein
MDKSERSGAFGHWVLQIGLKYGIYIITTVDGTPGVIKYIKDGQIDAACAQPAFQMATDAVDYLTKTLNGEQAIDGCFNNALAPVIITSENADSSELWGNNV